MRIILAKFVADFEAKVWSKSQTFVQTLSTRFGQDYEIEIQARLLSWSLGSILPVMLGSTAIRFPDC